VIDLHTHSLRSDGSDSPSTIVDLAADVGCSSVALTDHDNVSGIDEALLRAAERSIELIPGIELSCHTSSRNIHLLGYFVDHRDPIFLERLRSQQRLRAERNDRLAERLTTLGMEVTIEEVSEVAGSETIGRPHFAAVLMQKGHVGSIDEAFVSWLADDMPAHVERQELPAEIAIQWIHDAGGVASWAHPVWRSVGPQRHRPSIEPVVEELVAAGLDGIEARYSRYDGARRRELVRLAARFELVATGGSDYHGTYKPDLHIGIGVGDLDIPESVLDELRSRIPR
jgi:3',5'-nucleoside bisphosphate phosphatase